MQLTWLDVLAGNIGGAAIIAVFIFLWSDWRRTRAWQAAMYAWIVFVFAAGLFAWRAGCWAHWWECTASASVLVPAIN